jgi:protein involved in polysaccharide export with SLBB domain
MSDPAQHFSVAIFLAGIVLTAPACRTVPSRAISVLTPAEGTGPEDRVAIDDVVEVRVYGESDMTGTYRVGANGTFDFPLAGRIKGEGLTLAELQNEIVNGLKGRYLKDPQVSVMYKERNNFRKVSVLGQVQHPGPVPYYPNMTIVDAVASAGGFTPIAAKNSVTLRREITGRVELKTYPVADISEGRSTNVPLLPGDVVVVDERLF